MNAVDEHIINEIVNETRPSPHVAVNMFIAF